MTGPTLKRVRLRIFLAALGFDNNMNIDSARLEPLMRLYIGNLDSFAPWINSRSDAPIA